MTSTAQRSDPVGEIVAILREAGCGPKLCGGSWIARCPAHADRSPSLSVKRGGDGRALVRCHAGCDIVSVVKALGLGLRDLFTGPSGRSSTSRPAPVVKQRPAVDPRWADISAKFQTEANDDRLEALARQLSVSRDSLVRLRCGWARREALERICGHRVRSPAWTFPMLNGIGEVVGINARTPDGSKWTLSRGRLGLFVPAGLSEMPDPVWIVEGASDTAAAIDIGHAAVGRPSCNTGSEDLAELLQGRRVVVLGEDDRHIDADGKVTRWPGRDGAILVARRLAESWRIDVPVALPPAGVKDLRSWVNQRGVTVDDRRQHSGRVEHSTRNPTPTTRR